MKGCVVFLLVVCLANSVILTVPCQNGGYFDGVKCVCPGSLFYGPKCEFPVDEIRAEVETVSAKVQVQVKITNEPFTEELKNTGSKEYKRLESSFKKEMDIVYEKVPGYRGVIIRSLREGSIIVDHDVIIEAEIKNNVNVIEQAIQNVTEAVLEQLSVLNSTDSNCTKNSTFCFSAPPDPILNTTTMFNPEEYCRNITDPRYADYYYPNVTNGTLYCMTRCNKDSANFVNCNYGVCRITEGGPQCNCNDLSTFWYTDSFCRTRIHKGEAGFGIALGVVLLVSVVLAIFLFKAKRKKPELSLPDDTVVFCEDYEKLERVSSGSLAIKNEAASSYDAGSRGMMPATRP